MCGICGLMRPAGISISDVVRMNNTAAHRGPDGEAYRVWDGLSATGEFIRRNSITEKPLSGILAIGHRRLAILDLSDSGTQPMSYQQGNLWTIFNGEIYNYLELRAELAKAGHVFRTGTDTEVILAAYAQWGVECFSCFNGMWGLAIIDLRTRELVLSRDRIGIKPLYIWQSNQTLAFSSEIKQILTLPNFKVAGDMDSILEYVDTGYELPPATMFKDIGTFPAGCWSKVRIDRPDFLVPQAYWFPEKVPSLNIDQATAEEHTRFLFEDAVRLRLRSDVPVGVSLSGGLDSSSIASLGF